ncbi:MAG: hypothetical protein KJ983_00570, partial [Candidatus Omnitrophica bacterium]|nr:hypothetical protein [Candidatus Omnitrophota bacterium]
ILVKSKYSLNFSVRDYLDYYGKRYYLPKMNMENETCFEYLKWLRDSEKFNKEPHYFDYSFLTDEVLRDYNKSFSLFRDEQTKTLSKHLGVERNKIRFIDHHTCHAHYAYYGSPFLGEDSIVITLDGWGDGRNQTVWKASNDGLELLAESCQNDVGRVYKMATLILGMRPDEHEYKVMGLAPYAKKSYCQGPFDVIKDISQVEDMKIVYKNRPEDLFSYLKKHWEEYRFDNIAAAVQLYVETLAKELIEDVVKKTGIKKIVLSGGISMNVKMNMAIAELPCVSSLFVCGSGGDESLSLGGCYYLNRKNKNNRPVESLCIGYDVKDDLRSIGEEFVSDRYNVNKNVSNAEVARLLARGHIIARVCDCAEFGARALGNRSILADPSKNDVVQKINRMIKRRDFWMPFALSILEEYTDEYILNPKKIKAPFMALAFSTFPDLYRNIHAGTHPYDKTVRPQFVSKKTSTGYYNLIEEFRQLTGIPALLNTSFNLHGEPIVNDVKDSLRAFELSGLDHLLIEDTLVSKRDKKSA